jgi:hypothetical protein
MEIADFICLEIDDPPCLTLIHVKAAKSDSVNRQISVSEYEVVSGQAVKNLRYLDQILISDGLEAGIGRQVGDLVWHNRRRASRRSMIRELRDVGTDYNKKVVVLQPYVRKQVHDAARADMSSIDGRRLRQLDTLLLGAQANIRSLGAEFQVVMEE